MTPEICSILRITVRSCSLLGTSMSSDSSAKPSGVLLAFMEDTWVLVLDRMVDTSMIRLMRSLAVTSSVVR